MIEKVLQAGARRRDHRGEDAAPESRGMFNSNSFGSLAMDSSSEAGPSRIQNDGEEVDAEVCRYLMIIAISAG